MITNESYEELCFKVCRGDKCNTDYDFVNTPNITVRFDSSKTRRFWKPDVSGSAVGSVAEHALNVGVGYADAGLQVASNVAGVPEQALNVGVGVAGAGLQAASNVAEAILDAVQNSSNGAFLSLMAVFHLFG